MYEIRQQVLERQNDKKKCSTVTKISNVCYVIDIHITINRCKKHMHTKTTYPCATFAHVSTSNFDHELTPVSSLSTVISPLGRIRTFILLHPTPSTILTYTETVGESSIDVARLSQLRGLYMASSWFFVGSQRSTHRIYLVSRGYWLPWVMHLPIVLIAITETAKSSSTYIENEQ